MTQQNIDFVRGVYELFAEGDVPAVLEAMDPEIEWNQAENFPYADGNPYIGPQAVLDGVFMRLGSEWEYWKLDIHDVIGAGDIVIACGRYKAKNKATGRKLDAQFAHFWGLRDGKLAKFQQYADTYQAMAAVAS